jgi:hypothetical protein
MTMARRARLAGILIGIASLANASTAQQASVAVAQSRATEAPPNTEKRVIKDPVVNGMDAIEVTIPAKWHFQGGMYLMAEESTFLGDRCSSSPTGVYRATSPDGLSFTEELPSPAWGWASGPNAAMYGVKDCFPLQGPISAQDLLKYIAATLGVEYLGDETVPAERLAQVKKKVDDSNASYAKLNQSGKYEAMKWTADLAWAEVRSRNGTFLIKGRLRGLVSCTEAVHAPFSSKSDRGKKDPTTVDTCQAILLYDAAPESDYPALIEQLNQPGMGTRILDTWVQAWVANRSRSLRNLSAEENFIEQERRLSWNSKVYLSEQVRKKMIEDFDVWYKQGTEKALVFAGQRSRDAIGLYPDWVDYLLASEIPTVSDATKQEKPSSAFHKWVDSAGNQWFEAKDPDVDPNGILAGNWTSTKNTTAQAAGTSPASESPVVTQ